MAMGFRVDSALEREIRALKTVLGADSEAQVIEKAVALAKIAGGEAKGDNKLVTIGEQTISLNT